MDRKNKPMRPTMDDVAARAGVSQMTVSRVLRGAGYVSADVRDRVTIAAKDLGYVHNRIAGGLRAEQTPLVAVILPTLGNRVFSEVLSGINDALTGRDYQPVFGVTEYSETREEELVLDLLSWRPTGIILPGLEHSDATRTAIGSAGVRVAEVMDLDGDPIEATFGVSQSEAGRLTARHMLSRGYRRFAYLGSQGRKDLRAAKRLAGFRETISAAGAEMLTEINSDEPSSMLVGRQMTAHVLSNSKQPDAIYFSNDDLAAGGLMHCLAEGISVPGKVALAGFNGLSFLEALPIRLTTVETPRREMGRQAALSLIGDQRSDAVARRYVDLGLTLIEGETC